MKLFILPGDKFVSKEENLHFHRGHKYTVSYCFRVKDGLSIFVKDKHGFDVPLNAGDFEPSDALYRQIDERMFRSRILFFWDNASVYQNCKTHLYNFQENEYFELSKAYFIGNPKAKAIIRKYKLDPSGPGNYRYFYDELAEKYIYEVEEFINYFKDFYKDDRWKYNFHLPGLNSSTQENIDYLYFLNDSLFPLFDKSVLRLPEKISIESTIDFVNNGFQYFLDYLSRLIFDKPELTEQSEKDLINDILSLFKELPTSHGCTSMTKILLGRSKVKNSKVEHLAGKYKDFIKYDQLYELCAAIECYLFKNHVLATKENYGSGEEWRGTFEFIGNKYVNKDELEICINYLK